jgi:DNA-binding CsgD family transcriptional regulator
MRKVLIFIYLIIIATLVSCHRKDSSVSESSDLQKAEALMYAYPDSAFTILRSINQPLSSEGETATWALLMTQVRYKLYMSQDDSLIRVAWQYFGESNDLQKKALALYLRAVLSKEKNEIEQAQTNLIYASEIAIRTNDYQLCHLIYSALGNIYTYRGLNDYLPEVLCKSLEYAIKSGNERYMMAAHRGMARGYRCLKKYEKEIEEYKKAIAIAQNHEWHIDVIDLKTELANTSGLMGNEQKCASLIRQTIDACQQYSIPITPQQFYTIGEAYRQVENDSAYYYLEKALPNSDVYNLLNTNNSLYRLFREKNLNDSAVHYLEKAVLLQDSIHRLDKYNSLIEMKQKYDEQKVVTEKVQMERQKDKIIYRILILLLLLIGVMAWTTSLYHRNLRRKRLQIQESENKVNSLASELQKNRIGIRQNLKQIENLTKQIDEQRGLREQLDDKSSEVNHLILQNEILEKKLSLLTDSLLTRISTLEKMLTDSNETLLRMKSKHKYLNDKEWQDVYRAMDAIFDNITLRLTELLPSITETELNLCCLIKLHFTNKEISDMLAISTLTVIKYKQRFREHLSTKIPTLSNSKMLEQWIQDF